MAPRAPRGAPEPAVISQKIKAAFGKLTTAAHQPALPPDYLDSVVRDLSLVGPRPRKVISRRKMLRTLATMKKRAEVLNGDLAAMVALPIDWRVAIGLTAELNLPQLAPAIGGAPSKTLASRAARIAARHYWLWTGTRPHVRRPYAELNGARGRSVHWAADRHLCRPGYRRRCRESGQGCHQGYEENPTENNRVDTILYRSDLAHALSQH